MNKAFIAIIVSLILSNAVTAVFVSTAHKEKTKTISSLNEKTEQYALAIERLKSEKNKLDEFRSKNDSNISTFDLPTEDTSKKTPVKANVSVCIDAGHGITNRKEKEAVSPSSSELKAANVSGAAGEEPLNLEIAKKLKTILETSSIKVDMTRTENKCDKTNIERAKQANASDYSIRIHCDGNNNTSANGISVLVPEKSYFDGKNFVSKSRSLGETVLKHVTAASGAKNNGISVRGDLTGFNWSEVPCILVECGFVSNPYEFAKLQTESYQQKIAQGIADGFLEFLKMQ